MMAPVRAASARLPVLALALAVAMPGVSAAQTATAMPPQAERPASRPPLSLHDEPAPAAPMPPAGQPATPPAASPIPVPTPMPAPIPPSVTFPVTPPAPPPVTVAPAPTAPAPTPGPEADDAVAVVRAFYEALGRGDGHAANAWLVPEKRGRGAYDPDGIAAFYGAMREPLRVVGTGRLDERIVRVSYEYVHRSGRRCSGGADVSLVRSGGRLLIERIRPLSGC